MNFAAQDGHQGAAAQFRAPGLPPGNSAAVPASESASASGRHVGVTRLVLTDFRNYRSARLDLDGGPVVLTGPNGAGKTNLLEAVSFLSPGRGLRRARLADIDRHDLTDEPGASGWAVAAAIATSRGPVRIGTGREAEGGERRVIRIDGEPARSQASLAECLGVLWLTPQMDRLFVEGPGGRRRFLDRLVLGLDPAHAARVAAYEQAMRERARLLRDGPSDPAWLSALEEVMAQQGVAVAAARRDCVERLDRVCADSEGAFPRARLALIGTVEDWLAGVPALEAEDHFKRALAQNRAADAASGGATLGPHRSDLAVTYADKGIAAETASTGEQKALLIAIVLAQAALQRATRGEPPILLLDEVAAHLDESRRAALFEALAGLESQTWITGTDTTLFAPLRNRARFLSVADGALSETIF
ncbi:MAG: DNA replication/repair protein RecF [Alphaproteobacteria bacterium]|nr:DNA replication/repair protein RecF [Alphaproteobacteria bacterium]MBV9964500.1 DNA replication/repair protein RecF [Alphaproteobacteria bacterium]